MSNLSYGQVYWYTPRPTMRSDHRCEHCGFLFGFDEGKEQRRRGEVDGTPVLALHPTRARGGVSFCPTCGETTDLGEGWHRVQHMIGNTFFGRQFADVQEKWLRVATSEEIARFYLADEDAVDLGYNGLRGMIEIMGGGSLRALDGKVMKALGVEKNDIVEVENES